MISQDNTYWHRPGHGSLHFIRHADETACDRWWLRFFFIFLRCTFVTKRKWNIRSYFTYRYVFNTVVLSETLVSVKSWNNEFCTYDRNWENRDCTSFWLVQKPRWATPKIPASQYRSIILFSLVSFALAIVFSRTYTIGHTSLIFLNACIKKEYNSYCLTDIQLTTISFWSAEKKVFWIVCIKFSSIS